MTVEDDDQRWRLKMMVSGWPMMVNDGQHAPFEVSLQSQLQSQHRGAQSKEEGIRRTWASYGFMVSSRMGSYFG